MSAPYPPGETADDVRAMLRTHHPDLTDAQIDAILDGEPPRRRRGWQAGKQLTAGVSGPQGGGGIIGRGRSRSGRGARRQDR